MCYVFYSKLSDSTAVTVNSGGDKPRPYKKLASRKVGAGFIPARKQHIIDCGGFVQELLNSDDLMSCILILGALPECGGAFLTSSNQWPILCAPPVRTMRSLASKVKSHQLIWRRSSIIKDFSLHSK